MRTIPVHRSLYRRMLILGGERDLVQILAFLCFLLAFGGMTKVSIGAACVLWFGGLKLLQKMGKVDPYLSMIFSRHIAQQEFYAARTTVWRER